MTLAEQDGGAHATIATDLQLSGRAAAMGRGVIGDVAQKLVETFAGNLASMLAGPAAPAEDAQPAGVTAEPAAAAASGNGATTETPSGPAEIPSAAPAQASVPWPPPAPVETPAAATASAPPPPPSRPPKSAPAGTESLPVVQIAASVIAGRLKNPRTLLVATGALGLTFGAIGYALGRSR
jgi:hypothetical protein